MSSSGRALPVDGKGSWRAFIVNVTLIIVLFVTAIYAGIFLNARSAVENELHNRAQSIFGSIVLTRRWAAGYGGVYVEKKPGVESNPYLHNPDIRAADGKVYTLKNPALVTREISKIAEKGGEFQFHITSLKPVNPNNAPDAWERSALQSFESGAKEAVTRETIGDSVWYRYMAPLRFEPACAQCHNDYRVGDVRGGIAVRFNIDEAEAKLQSNLWTTIVLLAATLVALLLVIYHGVATLYRKLRVAEDRIYTLAITDELTGVHSRRHLLERLEEEVVRARRYERPLGCIILDLDHFKRVNDEHGHAAGDAVLRAVGERLRALLRGNDVVGRYGGEEFIVALPELGIEASARVAGKLRQAIERLSVDIGGGKKVGVTASLGVAALEPASADDGEDARATAAELVNRADEALYRAKEGGRNSTVISGFGADDIVR